MVDICNQILDLVRIGEYEPSKALLIFLEMANLLVYHVVFIEGDIPSLDDRIYLRDLYTVLVDAVIAYKPSNDCAWLEFVLSYLLRDQNVSFGPYDA